MLLDKKKLSNKNPHISRQAVLSIYTCYMFMCTVSLEERGGRGRVSTHTPLISLLDGNPLPDALSASGAGGRGHPVTRLLFWRAFPYPHPTCLCVVRSTAAPLYRITINTTVVVHWKNTVNM